ncbi:hypothetical protein [Pseudomonas sp. KCJK9111]|uniref:hypothetical protein n=1 Tax=Pseudomonas sp. KCJK9111 TaxID=3344555 RepID=UPI003906115D
MEFQTDQLDDLSIRVLTTLFQAFPNAIRLLPADFGIAASHPSSEELAPKYGPMPLLATKNFLMGQGLILLAQTEEGAGHKLSATGLYTCEKMGFTRDVAWAEDAPH